MLSKWRFVLAAVFLLWLKTYIVCKSVFDMELKNKTQELLLGIGPISSLFFFVGLSLFVKGKWQVRMVIGISFLLSLVLCANVIFYGFFHDFLTLPLLSQGGNMGDLASSIRELTSMKMILLFSDVGLLIAIARLFPSFARPVQLSKAGKAMYFLSVWALFSMNLALAEFERPQLLTRSFDRELLVKNIGLFNYHVYDAVLQSHSSAQRALADGNQLAEIENYTAMHKKRPRDRLFGSAQGKNIIIVSMESMQNFVIDSKINNQELTPFLNKFKKESYYFNQFYHQTGQGKTSDAEFIMENSLFPLDRGAVFFTHSGNEFVAFPEMIKERGYYSAVFHANNKSFWNRDLMYPSLGYDRYFHGGYYAANADNSVGWGLKDREFFDQSIAYMKSLPQPFYVKYITLTNHFPFELQPQDELIQGITSVEGTLKRYFETVRYTDEAIRYFVEQLKKEGLYDDMVLVLYGDHYGISENHNSEMSRYLGKEAISPLDQLGLQRVPLFIHIPGQTGGTISHAAGQVDMKPTLLHLLGIDEKRDLQFGEDLFSPDREEFTVLRDGSFILNRYAYTRGVCYDKGTGQPAAFENCEPYMERAKTELRYSDAIIYGDLLRFFEGNKRTSKQNKTVF